MWWSCSWLCVALTSLTQSLLLAAQGCIVKQRYKTKPTSKILAEMNVSGGRAFWICGAHLLCCPRVSALLWKDSPGQERKQNCMFCRERRDENEYSPGNLSWKLENFLSRRGGGFARSLGFFASWFSSWGSSFWNGTLEACRRNLL